MACGDYLVSEVFHTQSDRDTRLAYQIIGDPEGSPVFFEHGTPGSRLGPLPRAIKWYRAGIKVITHDRPGYGESERQEGRAVVDGANDVRAIADTLGIDRFSVTTRSGGGPYGLACAAKMPSRVVKTLVLASPGPPTSGDWSKGMVNSNASVFNASRAGVIADITERYKKLRADPRSLLDTLIRSGELSRTDAQVVGDVVMRGLIEESYQEAIRQGPDGWIDDVLAVRSDWGFDLSEISGPVEFWTGSEDGFVPASHSMDMARRTGGPHATVVTVARGLGHFAAMEELPGCFGRLHSGQ